LAVARTAGKVTIRFGRLGELHRAFDPDLFLETRPVLAERRLRILGELARFAAAVVRIEDESSLVNTSKQDHTYGWTAARVCRRQRDWRDGEAGLTRSLRRGQILRNGIFRRIGVEHPADLHTSAAGHGRCSTALDGKEASWCELC